MQHKTLLGELLKVDRELRQVKLTVGYDKFHTLETIKKYMYIKVMRKVMKLKLKKL